MCELVAYKLSKTGIYNLFVYKFIYVLYFVKKKILWYTCIYINMDGREKRLIYLLLGHLYVFLKKKNKKYMYAKWG